VRGGSEGVAEGVEEGGKGRWKAVGWVENQGVGPSMGQTANISCNTPSD
jgi:hypothetical protein